jgi:hypothetical protein
MTHVDPLRGTCSGALRSAGMDAFEWKLAVINESAMAFSISSSSFVLVGAL